MLTALWAVVAVLLSSCKPENQTAILYPIDSLLDGQVDELVQARATLTKFAMIGDKADTTTLAQPDTMAWEKEFEIFRELNLLNKPANQNLYLIDDNLYDPGSNLTVKAFTSTEPTPVRSMRVFYEQSVLKPRKIEAVYEEGNALYSSSRQLSLNFQEINNKSVLTSYSIDGGQKMILSDSVSFTVRAKIQLDKAK